MATADRGAGRGVFPRGRRQRSGTARHAARRLGRGCTRATEPAGCYVGMIQRRTQQHRARSNSLLQNTQTSN
eukprot:5713585-Pleurochrysis_carterae.AAC.2